MQASTSDHGAGAIELGYQERPVGAAVQRKAAPDLVQRDVPVLQHGCEAAPQLVGVVLVVVDPDLGLLVHLLVGDRATGDDRDRLLDAQGRLADPWRGDLEREIAA